MSRPKKFQLFKICSANKKKRIKSKRNEIIVLTIAPPIKRVIVTNT